MGELVFVGLGLFDERDISLRGLEEAKDSDFIFAEFYTSLLAGFSLQKLESIIGKSITVLSRREIEDESGEIILQKAKERKVAFLVPGDPLIATTHIDLRIRAEKRGIKTHVVHAASIVSAVMGLSGLHNYKFGRSVTIPFPEDGVLSRTPYEVIMENRMRNLHTLCFLDVDAEKRRYMTIRKALKILLMLEEKIGRGIITLDSLVVGVSRAGSDDGKIKAGTIRDMLNFDFGSPPHVLVVPSEKLHFMEAEALCTLAGAPEKIKEMIV
mgnify:FL=1